MNWEANDCECFPCSPSSPHSLAPSKCHMQCTATAPRLVTHSDFCHSHFNRQEVTQQPSAKRQNQTERRKKEDVMSQLQSLPETSLKTEWICESRALCVRCLETLPQFTPSGRGSSWLLSADLGFQLCFQVSLLATHMGLSTASFLTGNQKIWIPIKKCTALIQIIDSIKNKKMPGSSGTYL